MPPRCQQRLPAETPPRITPFSHALRIAVSTPCSRQSASRFATEPPPTHTRSLPPRRSSGSADGWGKTLSSVTSQPAALKAS